MLCPLGKLNQHDSSANNNTAGELQDSRDAFCQLCRMLYSKGWLSAAGGSISIRDGNKIYFGPIGTESNTTCPLESYILDIAGQTKEIKESGLELTEHKSIMMLPHILLNAGAVIHSHSMNSMLVTWLYEDEFFFSVSSRKIKVPIVENSSEEQSLLESLSMQMKKEKGVRALLVRGHGSYVWGKDWMDALSRAEHCEFLFEEAVKLKQKNL